jgi:anti-anti-sigma factor
MPSLINDGADLSVVVLDRRTVAVVGELDVATAPTLRALLDAESVRVVDLSGVTFIDVAGLRVLLERRHLVVRSPSRPVRRLIELCGRAGVCLGPTFPPICDQRARRG